ncbi:MAG: hypothetical protein QOH48_2532 [Actinomycetota bacterium]|jgi:hypothetical protein|nr:hypothetical protein [Actinomycetota bacterium]
MEIEGHPTGDLIEELERRGGVRVAGTSSGPDVNSLRFVSERFDDASGFWMFLPNQAYLTGMDDLPLG